MVLGASVPKQALRVPIISVAHVSHSSATQSCPPFGILQVDSEFFQPAIRRIHVGHKQTHGPNDLSVPLSTERATCRDPSQGACQNSPEIGLDFLAVNREKQADYVL